MLKKRLIGAIVVRQGWAVQSYNYTSWRPIGKPRFSALNLDRWEADGIALISVDRGDQGPDIKLLEEISSLGLSTPITYGGGIRTKRDAICAVSAGAERILIDTALNYDSKYILDIASAVGTQALIATIPLKKGRDNKIYRWNHCCKCLDELVPLVDKIKAMSCFSELLLIDVDNEGTSYGFDFDLKDCFGEEIAIPKILFGGLGLPAKASKALDYKDVAAVMIGNSLSYSENAVLNLKEKISSDLLRPHWLSQVT